MTETWYWWWLLSYEQLDCCFPGHLQVQEILLQDISTYFGCCFINCSFISHITLVSNQQLVDIFTSISWYFFKPLFKISESLQICTIVDHNDTMSTSVVRWSDSPKPFLTCSIPLRFTKKQIRDVNYIYQHTISYQLYLQFAA